MPATEVNALQTEMGRLEKKKRRPPTGEEENEDINKLSLNSDFAKKYDDRKRREILGSLGRDALEELEEEIAQESEDSEEDEEDEFGELLTKKMDKQISNTFLALRNKDPAIYDKSTVFFKGSRNDVDDESENSEQNSDSESQLSSDDEPVAGWDTIAKAAESAGPKLTIKDYVRETLLDEGDLPDSDAERFTGRRHVEEENEQVASEKTKLVDTAESSDDSSSNDNDSSSDEEENETVNVNGNASQPKSTRDAESSDSSDESSGEEDEDSDDDCSEKDEPASDDDDDDNEEFFTKKVKSKEMLEQEEKDFDSFTQHLAEKNTSIAADDKELHSYLEKDSAAKKDRFLKDFILNNGWLDDESGKAPGPSDYSAQVEIPELPAQDPEDDEDEELEDKVDEFEARYNFRFEEPDGIQVASHARDISASMRRPDERRKRAREAKKMRKGKEKLVKAEEIKQLKNLKKKEIQSRLLALQEAAGVGMDFSGIDLDADFDPDEFSKQMENKFNENYYAKDDAELKVGDDDKPVKAASAAEVIDRNKMDEAELAPGVHDAVDDLMNEYYNLDYEDIVGGVPVRFKYKQVEAEDFGMRPEEILVEEDKELNRRASLKYLAPYRDRKEVKMRAKTARWRAKQHRRSVNSMKSRETEGMPPAADGGKRKRKIKSEATEDVHDKVYVPDDAQVGNGSTRKSKKRSRESVNDNDTNETPQENGEVVKKVKKRKKRRHGKKISVVAEAPAPAPVPVPNSKDKMKASAIGSLSENRLAAYDINNH